MVEGSLVMSTPREEAATHRIMERLLECNTAQGRSAILLDSLISSKLCQSAALWRQVGTGAVKAWHPVLSRGRAALLPTLEQLRGVARGELPCELSGGRYVLLPIGRHNFALALGTQMPTDELSEERLDSADALFHVWMAVEVAESVGQKEDLLETLPSLTELVTSQNPGTPWQTPFLDQPNLAGFIEAEASWLLDTDVELTLEVQTLPRLALSKDATEGLIRDLLSHAAAGQSIAPSRIRVEVTVHGEGAMITIEDDGGWPPSMQGNSVGRYSSGLFDATAALNSVGGECAIEKGAKGGMITKAIIPGETNPVG